MRLYFFFLSQTVFISTLPGQQSINLEQCISYAFEHNLEIKEGYSNASKSRVHLKQAKLKLLPEIYFAYNHSINSGRSLNLETYSWENKNIQQGSMAFNTELVLFEGLYNLYNKRAAKISSQFVLYEIESRKLSIGLKIIPIFYRIALSNASIEVLKLSNCNTKNEIETLEEGIRQGTKAKSQLFELQAQDKREQIEILSRVGESEKRLNDLKQLLNWPTDTLLILDTDNKVNFYSKSYNKYPTEKSVLILLAKKEIALSSNAIRLKRSSFYPVIRANASISSRYIGNQNDPLNKMNSYDLVSQIRNNQYKQLNFSISIPIYNNYQNRTALKLAEIEVEESKINLEQVKNQLNGKLANIEYDIYILLEKISESKRMVQFYHEAYLVAREKFNAGLLDTFTLNLAKNNYTRAQLENNSLEIELAMNIALLKHYIKFSG